MSLTEQRWLAVVVFAARMIAATPRTVAWASACSALSASRSALSAA